MKYLTMDRITRAAQEARRLAPPWGLIIIATMLISLGMAFLCFAMQ